MYTLKVKGILNECIYHPSQSQAARRPDGPRPIFMLLPALPSSVSLAIGGFCCAPVSQGRGPSGWPGPSDVYLDDDRRTLATGEVWACFCVFSIMLHSSGLIGEPRDAGAFATHPHTKSQRDGGPVLKEEKAAGVVSLIYAWACFITKGDGAGDHHTGRRR